MKIESFGIKCDCGRVLSEGFMLNSDQMRCQCKTLFCKKIHHIKFPAGYYICKECKGIGYFSGKNKWEHDSNCDKCNGTGLLSWTDKIMRSNK